MEEEEKNQPVAKVAADLGVKPQLLYRLIGLGLLSSPGKVGRSKAVDPKEAAKAIKEYRKTANSGRRHVNWTALTDYLKESATKEVRLEVERLREITEAPHAKFEMLHYWDPYRLTKGHGPGLKAIRDADFEIASIEFAHSKFIGYIGASIIVVRRDENE